MENNFDIKKFLIENKLTRLSEQEDEWDFEAGEEWNVKELTVGDKLTPEMFQDSAISYYGGIANATIMKYDNDGIKDYAHIEYNNNKGLRTHILLYVDVVNDKILKPQYQIVPPLNESEDEWDLEAGEEWNIKDLTAGDYITQEMLNDTPFTKAWRALNQDIKIVGFKKDPFVRDTLCVVEYIDEWNETRQNDIDIESFNKYFLKPGYRIVAP